MTEEFDNDVFVSVMDITGDKFKNVISKYFENASTYEDRIKNALEQGNYKELADAAHPLSSSSAALGFVALASKAKEMENFSTKEKSNKENDKKLEEMLKYIKEHLPQAEEYVQKLLKKKKYGRTENPLSSGEAIKKKQKIRIMHIDDDSVICRITKAHLENSGYFETCSFPEIEEALKSVPFSPDIILVDYMMPDTEGMVSLLSIKADPNLAEIPVIFITGLEENIVRNAIGDTAGYIKKPYTPEYLINYILEVYEKKVKKRKT